MNVTGLSTKEIKQQIFDEIDRGTHPQTLKESLRQQVVLVEGYYFTTRAKHSEVLLPPSKSTLPVRGLQVFWSIVTVFIIILRIAKCSSSM